MVTYIFRKDKHAKILLENLAEMQSENGLLTDVSLTTRTQDYKVNFHSMLLAACSPTVKKLLVSKSSTEGTKGTVMLQGLTKELLECFREFIYKSEVTLNEDILDDLYNFAVKYDIDVLATIRGELEDLRGSNRVKFEFDNHEDVLSELFDMFMETELTTTFLQDQRDEYQFAVHGPLIAAASPALKEALLHGYPERKNRRLDVPSIALADVIGYIYSAKVTVQRQNAVGLLRAACTYEMPALAKVCCEWLISKLHTYDVVGLLCLCRELDSEYTKNLEEESKNRIITNFSELSAEDEFYALSYVDLKEIIQYDSLDIEDEQDVVDVVMRWIGHAEETRLPYLDQLLSCARLMHTSTEFLDELERDPRIGNSPGCLQVIEDARQRLRMQAVDDESETRSIASSYDEGFQDFESHDEDSLSRISEETFLGDHDDASSTSDRVAAWRDSLRDSFSSNSCPHDGNHPDSNHNSDSYLPDSDSRDYYQPDSYSRDIPQPENYSRDSYQPDTYSRDSYQSDKSSCDSYQPKRRLRKRIDGRPDMRCKENRQLHLENGANKNGTPDKRLRENRTKFLNKDGSPDMRCKVNKEAIRSPYSTSSVYTSASGRPSSGVRFLSEVPLPFGDAGGPLKKNGTPDRRYAVNKQRCAASFAATDPSSHGPMKKDGTLDMRYAVNKQRCAATDPSSHGPLKKNGTLDMRYAVNKQRCEASFAAAGTSSHGPLKKDGTLDMRYAVNRRQCYNPSPPSSKPSGPLKKNGTPDMRFKANRR